MTSTPFSGPTIAMHKRCSNVISDCDNKHCQNIFSTVPLDSSWSSFLVHVNKTDIHWCHEVRPFIAGRDIFFTEAKGQMDAALDDAIFSLAATCLSTVSQSGDAETCQKICQKSQKVCQTECQIESRQVYQKEF